MYFLGNQIMKTDAVIRDICNVQFQLLLQLKILGGGPVDLVTIIPLTDPL